MSRFLLTMWVAYLGPKKYYASLQTAEGESVK